MFKNRKPCGNSYLECNLPPFLKNSITEFADSLGRHNKLRISALL